MYIKTISHLKLLFIPVLLTLLLCSCDSMEEGRVCTAVYISRPITVLQHLNSETDAPVDSLQITVKKEKNGEVLIDCKGSSCSGNSAEGQYVIFNDGLRDQINPHGEDVIVTGTKDNLTFTQSYTFGSDGCHMQEIAGKDTVFVHPLED